MSVGARSEHRKGRPLAMLALLTVLWISGRAVLWESPFAGLDMPGEAGQLMIADKSSRALAVGENSGQPHALQPVSPPGYAQQFGRAPVLPALARPLAGDLPAVPNFSQGTSLDRIDKPGAAGVDARTAAAHQLLWMAAMAHMPVPDALARTMVGPTAPPAGTAAQASKSSRWSLDAWAFWRDGSGSAAVSQGRVPSYGASQAGAVLRYRLAPQSRHAPNAYMRAYRALISGGESEIAAGVSARPLPSLPVRAHAEMRATRLAGETRFRPSAFATTELPPVALPKGFQAEVYAQAGYVGGPDATAFADGQLHVMRAVRDFDLGRLSVGGAAWAGAQKGADRLDLGPSMRFDVTLGETPARLSVDWRERVSGNAEPESGVAVTLSTRF